MNQLFIHIHMHLRWEKKLANKFFARNYLFHIHKSFSVVRLAWRNKAPRRRATIHLRCSLEYASASSSFTMSSLCVNFEAGQFLCRKKFEYSAFSKNEPFCISLPLDRTSMRTRWNLRKLTTCLQEWEVLSWCIYCESCVRTKISFMWKKKLHGNLSPHSIAF